MLKESDFRNYFEGEISAKELVDKIQCKKIERSIPESPFPQSMPRTVRIEYDNQFHDLKNGFILEKNHLIRLCDDFLTEKISAWNLEDIAFILYACDGISWGNSEEERKLIVEIMFHLSSPEINFPLTKEYVQRVKELLK